MMWRHPPYQLAALRNPANKAVRAKPRSSSWLQAAERLVDRTPPVITTRRSTVPTVDFDSGPVRKLPG